MPWTPDDLPDLSGRTVVVTGANSGIGLEAARQLARRGADVVIACRNPVKAAAALEEIQRGHPGAALEALPLDLANLESVRCFAKEFLARREALHVLVNNAGVMALPYRQTADGFEMQLGTNHLGHFALTGLLLERLLATPQSRVVTVSSGMHRAGRMRFEDLQSQRRYGKWRAYAQSKLANLLFAYELQRRSEARGTGLKSVACHPGYAATNLQLAGPRMQGSSLFERLARLGNRILAQSPHMGALPTLYAAADPEVRGGDYIGPDGPGELRGHPTRVNSSARSRDRQSAAKLWDVSRDLTGVGYEALTG